LKNPNISEIEKEIEIYRTNRTPSYTSGVHWWEGAGESLNPMCQPWLNRKDKL